MQFFARALIALSALLPLACSAADAPQYELGKDFRQVRTPIAPADPGKIEVTEVFSYSCPHCFSFEQPLAKWLAKKPADVTFSRLPHTLGAQAGEIRNKAMYTAEMLGQFEKFHHALFAAIHGQSRMMSNVEEVRGLFVQATGVSAAEFDSAYGSFMVDSKYRIGEATIRDMGITSVPTLVVDGKWYASPRAGGGFPEVLKITDYLIQQARKQRGKK
jgi:thiol:disulfide interchange protein DsbA